MYPSSSGAVAASGAPQIFNTFTVCKMRRLKVFIVCFISHGVKPIFSCQLLSSEFMGSIVQLNLKNFPACLSS